MDPLLFWSRLLKYFLSSTSALSEKEMNYSLPWFFNQALSLKPLRKIYVGGWLIYYIFGSTLLALSIGRIYCLNTNKK